MSKKRKDSKGTVLRKGEYQKKADLYEYRYQDQNRRLQSVYAKTLPELREVEKRIQKDLLDGIDYAGGKITVLELVRQYLEQKPALRQNSLRKYRFTMKLLEEDGFGSRLVGQVKILDAKKLIIRQHEAGKGTSTLNGIRALLEPAFQMACEENIIRQNPFSFSLSQLVPADVEKKQPLTPEDKAHWLEFIRNDPVYGKYYDEFVVLLNTGLRVSEFCGLTVADLDFQKHLIRVERQLLRSGDRGSKPYINPPKSSSGNRVIPMVAEVEASLRNLLAKRPKPKVEPMIDGVVGFLMLNKNNNPKVASNIESMMYGAEKRYQKLYPDTPLPHITPHVLRHTFCTDMATGGMDVKSLQMVMGHADVQMTLNVYAHANVDVTTAHMNRILSFQQKKNVRAENAV